MTTSQPISKSEMQLYRVLQRANLLSYYETFIAQGGDDVQQLCEAGEDEFLEIMALVGMASKPLHVRRLQKTLQEWVTNPASFSTDRPSTTPTPGSISATVQQQGYVVHSTSQQNNNNNLSWSGSSTSSVSPPAIDHSQDKPPRSSTSPNIPAALVDEQIAAIASAAERLARSLPIFAPKDLNLKKGFNREVMEVMMMTDDDSDRLDKLRKYAAIYGRFDSKRKNDRPMSLHELSVNEASAQLCRFVPALLTRREDLFPLARQVVRDSGYQYSKGHSSSQYRADHREQPSNKKIKLDNQFNTWLIDQLQRPIKTDLNGNKEHQIREISTEIKNLRDKMDSVRSLIQEAKERNDTEALGLLQDRIETLTSRQLILLSELEEFTALPESAPKLNHSLNGICDDDEFSDSSNMPSGASSPAHVPEPILQKHVPTHGRLPQDGTVTENDVNLFEEGLRIAQQYGLADFAEELKELQQQKGDDENGSEKTVEKVLGIVDGIARRNDEVKRNMAENRASVGNSGDMMPKHVHIGHNLQKMVTTSGFEHKRVSDRALNLNMDSSRVLRGLVERHAAEKQEATERLKGTGFDTCDREVELQNFPRTIVESNKLLNVNVNHKELDAVSERIVSSTLPSEVTMHAVTNLSPTSISIQNLSTRKVRHPSQTSL